MRNIISRSRNISDLLLGIILSIVLCIGMIPITSLNIERAYALEQAGPEYRGAINAQTDTITIEKGSQINLNTNSYFFRYINPSSPECHIDFKITGGSTCTIDRKTGILTAFKRGAAQVTAYLTQGSDHPTLENPCGPIFGQATININVVPSSSYGFQGNGALLIKMLTPSNGASADFTSYNGVSEKSDTNTLATNTLSPDILTPNGNFYYFTVQVLDNTECTEDDGWISRIFTPEAFANLNTDKVQIMRSGTPIHTLQSSNLGPLSIEQVDTNNSTAVFKVAKNAVQNGIDSCLSFC